MSKKLIEARAISKSFGNKLAVDNFSLQVREGEIYGLVGPDGAGKTTSMRLICGALQPDAGEVIVGGYSMLSESDKAKEHIGYLSQRFSLYEEMTVLENLRFFAEVRGLSANTWQRRTMEILEFVGLAEFVNRRAGHLSGGMKQKLGLASALVHNPRVLLLDEPTGGVDPVTRQDFWKLIIRLVTQEGVSVLVSTPYMDEAVRCTYVGFMQNGRLVIEDKPSVLINQLEGRIIEIRGGQVTELRKAAIKEKYVESVQTFGDRLHLRVRSGKANNVIMNLKRRLQETVVKGADIYLADPQLEDVFIAFLDDKDI
jgi:ABC-2 type transport system ATP-binding protein